SRIISSRPKDVVRLTNDHVYVQKSEARPKGDVHRASVSSKELPTHGCHGETGTLPSDYMFFFQAEDGIRSSHVTGVQTCALPISHHFQPGLGNVLDRFEMAWRRTVEHIPEARLVMVGQGSMQRVVERLVHDLPRNVSAIPHRSEERRVGKECRSASWPSLSIKRAK